MAGSKWLLSARPVMGSLVKRANVVASTSNPTFKQGLDFVRLNQTTSVYSLRSKRPAVTLTVLLGSKLLTAVNSKVPADKLGRVALLIVTRPVCKALVVNISPLLGRKYTVAWSKIVLSTAAGGNPVLRLSTNSPTPGLRRYKVTVTYFLACSLLMRNSYAGPKNPYPPCSAPVEGALPRKVPGQPVAGYASPSTRNPPVFNPSWLMRGSLASGSSFLQAAINSAKLQNTGAKRRMTVGMKVVYSSQMYLAARPLKNKSY